MKCKSQVISIIILVFFCLTAHGQAPANGQELLFADEFNGAKGEGIDKTKWSYETGGGGWGNQELQYYTDLPDNIYIDGAGSLVLKAVKLSPPLNLNCWYGPCQFTSGKLVTKGKFEHKYGRFEARIKVPRGQGIWPAFWLLGNDIDKVGWPKCGEIDVMENIGREPAKVHGTIHGPGYSGANSIGESFSLKKKNIFADDFHVFAVEWREKSIKFFVDGKAYRTLSPISLPQGTQWVFDHPFYILMNVAVGGHWPGSPDDTSVFPQTMQVDYVRVYKL